MEQLITAETKDAVVSAAAQSAVGKKVVVPLGADIIIRPKISPPFFHPSNRPTRKLVPQPDLLKTECVFRVCAQIRLHQPFKTAALVTFGKGKAAVFVKYLLKGHGGRLHKR